MVLHQFSKSPFSSSRRYKHGWDACVDCAMLYNNRLERFWRSRIRLSCPLPRGLSWSLRNQKKWAQEINGRPPGILSKAHNYFACIFNSHVCVITSSVNWTICASCRFWKKVPGTALNVVPQAIPNHFGIEDGLDNTPYVVRHVPAIPLRQNIGHWNNVHCLILKWPEIFCSSCWGCSLGSMIRISTNPFCLARITSARWLNGHIPTHGQSPQ